MNGKADGGGRKVVLVSNASSRRKGGPEGKRKPVAQSKNAPDSTRLSSAEGCNGRSGNTGTRGITRSTSATSSSGGGFQSFFRWFRRDDSRLPLARSTSGTEAVVTPELPDSRGSAQATQPQPPSQQRRSSLVRDRAASIETNSSSEEGAGAGAGVSRTGKISGPPVGDSVSQSASNGTHSSSPSPGPERVIDCGQLLLSKSSSCDSILSTATNGFAYVPPNCYEAALAGPSAGGQGGQGGPAPVRRTIQPGPYTDSYKRRCWQRDQARELDRKYELTLRKKYRLFAGSLRETTPDAGSESTLTRHGQRTALYNDLSLPTTASVCTHSSTNEHPRGTPNEGDPAIRRHRRTVSDSSKDRRAGAYLHVKGKRRAPPPPPPPAGSGGAFETTSGSSSTSGTLTRPYTRPSSGTLSPGSTLSRKKRPAPAPPTTTTTTTSSPLNEPSSSSTSLLEDREIKAIIEGRPFARPEPDGAFIMPLPLIRPQSPLPNISEERAPPGGLTEEQKQQLIDNIRRVQTQQAVEQEPPAAPATPPTPTNVDVMQMEEQFSRTNGTRSPIHDYLYAEAIAKCNAAMPASVAVPPPTSPISPRPWYKRPISGIRQQESSLPFKRDIILKTIDKRKGTAATVGGKHAASEDLPEVGYCRNSVQLHADHLTSGASASSSLGSGSGKFNLFAKIITEKSDDTKRRERDAEKRRSAIGIPSISELDREAAEIVHNERRCNGLELAGTDGHGTTTKQKSTKELISKFEATSVPVVGKLVMVNASVVARKDYFGLEEESPKQMPVVAGSSSGPRKPPEAAPANRLREPSPAGNDRQSSSSSTSVPTSASSGSGGDGDLAKTVTSDKNLLGLWTCPYCTLENPNWRIICEACERIKPYDSKLSILEEPPLRPNHPLKRPIPDAASRKAPKEEGQQQQQQQPQPPMGDDEWDRKTERVLKYFMAKPAVAPVPATNGTLLVGKAGDGEWSAMQRKPMYGSQLKPLASPKMGVKSLMKRPAAPDPIGAGAGGSNKFDDQKLKEGADGAAAIRQGHAFAPLASPEPPMDEAAAYRPGAGAPKLAGSARVNIEEIRSARIARFETGPAFEQQPTVEGHTHGATTAGGSRDLQDGEALEKEKERLREMIRAMNAKALAEKYPVAVQAPLANGNSGTGGSLKSGGSSPLPQRKNGLSGSGIPVSTKTSSPLPVRKSTTAAAAGTSPLVVRKSSAPGTLEAGGKSRDAIVPPVAPVANPPSPAASPNTGAIRKTSFPRRLNGTVAEGKIINQDTCLPETVAELNLKRLPPPPPPTGDDGGGGGGPSLVLTNDVQGIHYEPMDEQQFARSVAGGGPTHQPPLPGSGIPRPSHIPGSPRLQDRHRKTLLEKQQHHDEKVRQISDQLRSQQGVERFRSALLCSPAPGAGAGALISRTGTLAINKLLRNLELAISEGAHGRAAELAMDLAKMKVSLSVTRQSPGRAANGGSLSDISLTVYIDDKVSHKGPLGVTLAAFATVAQLKQKLCNEYQIPVAVQRWRCDDRPLDDDAKTLFDYGIQTNERILHVFLVQPAADRASEGPPPPAPRGQRFTPVEAKLLAVSSESEGEHSDTQNDETVLGATALPVAAPRGTGRTKTIAEKRTVSKEEPVKEEKKKKEEEQEGWSCPMCTLINPPQRPGCAACSEARPDKRPTPAPPTAGVGAVQQEHETITVTPEDLKRFLDEQPPLAPGRRATAREVAPPAVPLRNNPPLESRNDLNRISSNRKSSDIFNILLDESKASSAGSGGPPRTSDLVRPEPGYLQVPEQTRIVMTAALPTHRSPNITRSQYRGVDNFNPNSSGMTKPERPIITTASPIVRAVLLKSSATGAADKPAVVRFGRNGLALPEDGTEVTPNHYTELVNLDNADLIANIEPFECPICFGPFQPYEGIVLRDCLHSFCKQCLISTIQYSEDAAIRCPYSDTVYSCESIIQQREIKALVSKELYEAHLAKSIQQAESAIDNTFHCRTPNCRGWCIYEDNVNQFKCPVCRIVNCLTCRVVHDGLDCKQYQDRMNSDCDTNLEARRTKAMLQEMIEKGDALNCPTCQVIVMKKWGCDWLKCSMCKTEICWVTRGHRWGPAGRGDTSGGCRCGVNGIKCHPKCNYCH